MAQLPAHSVTDNAPGIAGELAAAATAAGVDPAFVERYLRHADEVALRERSAHDLVALATTHREVAATRAPQETIVEVVDGALHVVTADRPFLVDSVLGELASEGIRVSLLVHPLFVVRRDADGALLEVLDEDPRTGHDGAGVLHESWIRVELAEPCDLSLLRERVAEVVDAVAAAVDDWSAMRDQVLDAAALLEQGRGTGDVQEQTAQ